jgi:predicted dithiol-disulfide oxidoreductase (DUF899 family)
MQNQRIVPEAEWLAARKLLLQKEKELTRLSDELSRQKRELPWVEVRKNYLFEAPEGTVSIADLFNGRSQLIVYHFMFGPGWEEGCRSCSWAADNFDRNVIHLEQRDVTLVAVSSAPISKIESFRRRMGWSFRWVSSYRSDFNFDFGVSFTGEQMAGGKVNYNYNMQEFGSQEAPGLSVFYKDPAGDVFHTYSTYARGLEPLLGGYFLLDLVPKGRDEDQLAFPMSWVRHHDSYSGTVTNVRPGSSNDDRAELEVLP